MYTAFSVIVRWAAYGGKRRVVLPSKGEGTSKCKYSGVRDMEVVLLYVCLQ